MRFSEVLTSLRKKSGLTQSDVAAFLSERGKFYTFKNVSSWESGAATPPVEPFLFMCELYGVRDVLTTFFGLEYDYSSAVKLNEVGKERAYEYIKLLSRDPLFAAANIGGLKNDRVSSKSDRVIYLYDIPASAGAGSFLDSSSYVDLEVDETVPSQADFAVKIRGDSMTPRFVDGQIVFIKEQKTLDFGEIGVFGLNGDSYIKKLGNGELLSLNPGYDPIKVDEHSSFFVFGKVIG